jgi:hypothetical protein
LCIPHAMKPATLRAFHDSLQLGGHMGIERTYACLRRKCFWPHMSRDIREYVTKCQVCQATKPVHRHPFGLLEPSNFPVPLTELAIDLIGPYPETPRGNTYALVVTDLGSRWVMAWPLPDATTTTIWQTLQTHWFTVLGTPRKITCDNATTFRSREWSEFLSVNGIKLVLTQPYNAKANTTERYNQTIIQMLRPYCDGMFTLERFLNCKYEKFPFLSSKSFYLSATSGHIANKPFPLRSHDNQPFRYMHAYTFTPAQFFFLCFSVQS